VEVACSAYHYRDDLDLDSFFDVPYYGLFEWFIYVMHVFNGV